MSPSRYQWPSLVSRAAEYSNVCVSGLARMYLQPHPLRAVLPSRRLSVPYPMSHLKSRGNSHCCMYGLRCRGRTRLPEGTRCEIDASMDSYLAHVLVSPVRPPRSCSPRGQRHRSAGVQVWTPLAWISVSERRRRRQDLAPKIAGLRLLRANMPVVPVVGLSYAAYPILLGAYRGNEIRREEIEGAHPEIGNPVESREVQVIGSKLCVLNEAAIGI